MAFTEVVPFKAQELQIALDKQKQAITHLLAGSPVPAQKLMASVLVEIDKNPALTRCTLPSVIGAAIEIARAGLEIGGTLGDAYIVPFRGKAQAVFGYKGFVNLCLRSRLVKSIDAQAVYDNDEFDFNLGTDPWIRFRPCLKGSRGDVLCFFAVGMLPDGAKVIEIMTVEDVNKIRDASQGYQYAVQNAKPGKAPDSPWVSHYAEMGRKTAIRKVIKRLPKSASLQRLEDLSDALERGEDQGLDRVIDAEFTEIPTNGTVTRADGSVADAETGEILWKMDAEKHQRIVDTMTDSGLTRDEQDDLLHAKGYPALTRDYTKAQYDRVFDDIKAAAQLKSGALDESIPF